MSERPPVARQREHYSRDPRILDVCISDLRGIQTTEPPPPQDVALLATLEEQGATFPNPEAALQAIESAFDIAGDERAAQTLEIIFSRLPGGRRGDELRQALLGTFGKGAESARKSRVSKQAWCTSIRRLRARIFKNGLPSQLLVNGTNAETKDEK
jgi:hypothetical protein